METVTLDSNVLGGSEVCVSLQMYRPSSRGLKFLIVIVFVLMFKVAIGPSMSGIILSGECISVQLNS